MHILFLSDNFAPETNAPSTRLLEHARAWVRAGHRVTVVTCAPNFPQGVVHAGYANRWRSRETLDGIEVLRVWSYVAPNRGRVRRVLDYLSFCASGTLGALEVDRPDVVVATSPQFFAALGGWIVSALRGLPFVFELRDLWPASIAAVGAMRRGLALRAIERLELFLYARADAIVAVTDSFREDLVARGVDREKVHVVTNGVDLSAYAPTERDERMARELGVGDDFVVGYVGTHGLAHGLENVLDAAALTRHARDVRWLFVGDGAAKPALVEAARDLGLDRVRFEAPRPKHAMRATWSVCDAALVHLKDEPVFATVIPSKIFEAMGMGLPVILVAPEGEAAEIVRRTGCGLVVPPSDPAALASAAVRLRDDVELRRELARASRAAAPLFDRDALAHAMLRVLEGTARAITTSPRAQEAG